MTDEERQKLCDKLRVYGTSSFHGGRACKDAAAEIERLTKENKELKKRLHHLHSARETDMGVAE